MTSVATTLYAGIRKLKKRNPDLVISDDSQLKENLGITSLEMVSLLTDTCTKHDIDLMTLSDVDLAKMKRVSDVITILDSRL